MTIEELENGLFLDMPLQQFIERVTSTVAKEFLLCDEMHGDEYLKMFSLVCYKSPAILNKTIYNPPLETSINGTSTGTGQDVATPVEGTIQYKLSFFNYNGYTLIRCKNITQQIESFLFKRKELAYWNTTINQIQRDYY